MSHSKKLQLIQVATAAFPGTPVNTALLSYLRGRYSGSDSVGGLVSRYLREECQAYNFDGVDDRATLQTRAIDPDGDNTFEFWTPSSAKQDGIIVAQNITSTFASREFQLWSAANGTSLQVLIGGSQTDLGTITPETRYRLELVGSTFTLKTATGSVIRSGALARGVAREPAALTHIGANASDASFANFFLGKQYDLRINGFLWRLASSGQTVQPSTPSGNDLTLVNTNLSRWEVVPCSVRLP